MILSGVILFAGILYWLWSHIQLTQKKVQLLENAVFELRGLVGTRGPDIGSPASVAATASPAPRASPFKDLDDDDWDEPEKAEEVAAVSTPIDNLVESSAAAGSTSLEELGIASGSAEVAVEREGHEEVEAEAEENVSDDLMPGGRIYAPPDEPPAVEQQQERFRDLFVQPDVVPSPSTSATQSLESMPVNELRRLAIQRGIAGARDMRKKEILAALREGAAKPATPVHVPEDAPKEVNIADIIKGVEVKEIVAGEEETTEAEILE